MTTEAGQEQAAALERAQEQEWQSWQDVCKLLRDSGVVTDADLHSTRARYGGPTLTAGQRILAAITEWGDRLVKVHKLTPCLLLVLALAAGACEVQTAEIGPIDPRRPTRQQDADPPAPPPPDGGAPTPDVQPPPPADARPAPDTTPPPPPDARPAPVDTGGICQQQVGWEECYIPRGQLFQTMAAPTDSAGRVPYKDCLRCGICTNLTTGLRIAGCTRQFTAFKLLCVIDVDAECVYR